MSSNVRAAKVPDVVRFQEAREETNEGSRWVVVIRTALANRSHLLIDQL